MMNKVKSSKSIKLVFDVLKYTAEIIAERTNTTLPVSQLCAEIRGINLELRFPCYHLQEAQQICLGKCYSLSSTPITKKSWGIMFNAYNKCE